MLVGYLVRAVTSAILPNFLLSFYYYFSFPIPFPPLCLISLFYPFQQPSILNSLGQGLCPLFDYTVPSTVDTQLGILDFTVI